MSYLKKINLKNFRVFKESEFSLKEGINIVYGKNGSGKTSLMESVYILNYGKSFRTKRIKEILNGEDLYIEGVFIFTTGEGKIKFYFDGIKKNLLLEEKKTGLKEILERFFSIYVNSNRIDLFFKSRRESRKIIDIMCSGIDTLYLKELLKYNRILKQKNKLLKNIKIENDNYKIWTEKLSEQGKKLRFVREEFIEKINLFLRKQKIEIKTEEIKIEKNILFQKEKRLKKTLTGPHIDYFKVYKEGKPLSVYGSTGMNKTVYFEILNEYTRIFREKKGFSPILMLDDFDSDLDIDNLRGYTERFNTQTLLSFVDNKYFNMFKQVNILEV